MLPAYTIRTEISLRNGQKFKRSYYNFHTRNGRGKRDFPDADIHFRELIMQINQGGVALSIHGQSKDNFLCIRKALYILYPSTDAKIH